LITGKLKEKDGFYYIQFYLDGKKIMETVTPRATQAEAWEDYETIKRELPSAQVIDLTEEK